MKQLQKKLLRISLITVLVVTLINSPIFSQERKQKGIKPKNCKLHHVKRQKKIPNSNISPLQSHIVYHDLGTSKEDSITLSIIEIKDDIEYYLFLKDKVHHSSLYIDSLYNAGFKVDYKKYYQLKLEYAAELNKSRKKSK